ncbi:CREB3 protein, partial [Alectura lathami]|nr:CREB3 protein [Alectura lathami]
QLLDKEMHDFFRFLLPPFEDSQGPRQGCLSDNTDSGISEDQNQRQTPGNNLARSHLSLQVVQFDHCYSLQQDWPTPESVKSDMSLDTPLANRETLEQSSSDWMEAGAAAAEPLPLLEAVSESSFTELALTDEEKKLLEKEGVLLPLYLPLTEAEERLLRKVRRKIRNKQAAQDSRRRRRIYLSGLENRMISCTVQNNRMRKKVQFLQKQNTSLLMQVRKLRIVVKESTAKPAPLNLCLIILVVFCCLILLPSFYVGNTEEAEAGALSQQVSELLDEVWQAGPTNLEEDALEGLDIDPDDPSVFDILDRPFEGWETPPTNWIPEGGNNSSSDVSAMEVSDVGPPQAQEEPQEEPQEQHPLSEASHSGMLTLSRDEHEVEHTASDVQQ